MTNIKTFFLLVVWILSLFSSLSAENFFQEGMSWVYEGMSPSSTGLEKYTKYMYLEKTSDGNDCLQLFSYVVRDYEDSEEITPKCLCNIKTDGDKVFFSTLDAPDVWMLMYDFGLDWYSTVYVINSDGLETPPFVSYKVELFCLEINYTKEGLKKFRMYDIVNGGIPDAWGYGDWIDGIGSNIFLLRNCHYGTEGSMTHLESASLNGKTLYESPKFSDVENEFGLSDIMYKTEGNTVIIYNLNQGEHVEYFKVDGTHIESANADANGNVVFPIAPGISIIKTAHNTLKIAL